MTMQNELQIKFAEGYEFETMLTHLDSRYVMKGIWIFETEANSENDAIDFKATWVNNDSAKTTTVTYKSSKSRVKLTGIDFMEINKAPESPAKRSKSTPARHASRYRTHLRRTCTRRTSPAARNALRQAAPPVDAANSRNSSTNC